MENVRACVRVEKSWDERWFRVWTTGRMKYVKKKNKYRKDHTSCSSYSPSVTASDVKDKRTNTHCSLTVRKSVVLNDLAQCKCVMTADARYLCGSWASCRTWNLSAMMTFINLRYNFQDLWFNANRHARCGGYTDALLFLARVYVAALLVIDRSVRPSICLSHSWSRHKRFKISKYISHHTTKRHVAEFCSSEFRGFTPERVRYKQVPLVKSENLTNNLQ